ncbi:alpha/beta fold hydrolase [Variovorax saccharolyticus]|uniref:alpha/beta fold hydrolase n=1 Tax=Variovorax saccharolyticus TaxID=3053516 RepID=UPI002575122B|nr:alpha/beta hydrolase [Variovorax sp. J22R187]MDM0022233.1 alpha/beta hydrolase [Variovorax sp. J22R187]
MNLFQPLIDTGTTRRKFTLAAGAALAMGMYKPSLAAPFINTQTAGSRDPTFIFVHGFTCSLDDFKAQVDALSPNYRCVSLDLPGHGGSSMPEDPRIETLAAAVNEVKRRNGAGKVILVGHSMGVRVVREAYRQSSAGVSGLVLMDGVTYVGEMDVLISKLRDQIRQVGYPAYVQASFGGMFMEGSDTKLRDKAIARAMKLDPKFAEELLVENFRWELTGGAAALKEIAVPVLVIQSTYTNAQGKRVSMTEGVKTPFMELVSKVVPKADVRMIPGIGHFTMIEAPDTVNQYLREFAGRVA